MENSKDTRWKQRFVNFEKSYHLLKRTSEIEPMSEAEKGGLIQFYKVCFELSWKLIKDYLESTGYIVRSPREALKVAFQNQLITDGELWLSALDDRNLTSHIYDDMVTDLIISKIKNEYLNILSDLYQFFRIENEQ